MSLCAFSGHSAPPNSAFSVFSTTQLYDVGYSQIGCLDCCQICPSLDFFLVLSAKGSGEGQREREKEGGKGRDRERKRETRKAQVGPKKTHS